MYVIFLHELSHIFCVHNEYRGCNKDAACDKSKSLLTDALSILENQIYSRPGRYFYRLSAVESPYWLFFCPDQIADIGALSGEYFIIKILFPVNIGNAVF